MSTGALSGATRTPRHPTVLNVMTVRARFCRLRWARSLTSLQWRAPRVPDCRATEAELVPPTR
eukprot:10239258-Alexandrium_andersonii.AAC.1